MKTLVAILNHNLPEYTDYLYEALKPYEGDLYSTVVIDNGSPDEGKSKYTTYESPTNTYFGGGLNMTFELFLSEYKEYDSLLFLNNDLIVFGVSFVKTLQEIMLEDNLTLLSGTFFNVEADKQCHWKNMWNYGRKEVRLCKWIDFQMPMIHRRFIENVKQFDLDLLYGWGIDVYSGIVCEENNWNVGVTDRVSALHYNSLTVKSEKCELDIPTYCKNAETGQHKFFNKMGLTKKFHEFRLTNQNYKI